jgi:hypothetical protein
MSTPFNVEWIDVPLDTVLHHFGKDFQFKDGATLFRQEAFVDTAKNRVVFKLTTQAPEAS